MGFGRAGLVEEKKIDLMASEFFDKGAMNV